MSGLRDHAAVRRMVVRMLLGLTGAATAAVAIVAAAQDAGVAVLSTSDGVSVQVPAAWRRTQIGTMARAQAPDNLGEFTYRGSGPTALRELELVRAVPGVRTVDADDRRITFSTTAGGPLGTVYRVVVVRGSQAAAFECRERVGAEGAGACLSIARSVAFTAAPTAAASPAAGGSGRAPRAGGGRAAAPAPRTATPPSTVAPPPTRPATRTPAPAANPATVPASPVPPASTPAEIALTPETTQHSAAGTTLIGVLSSRSDVASLQPAQQTYAIHEAATSFDYCMVNPTLHAMLECGCYARAFLDARLESGFALDASYTAADREATIAGLIKNFGLTRAQAEETERRREANNPPRLAVSTTDILNSFITRARPIDACVSPDAIRAYARQLATRMARGTEAEQAAFIACVQEGTVERVRQRPLLDINAVGGAVTLAAGGCRREAAPMALIASHRRRPFPQPGARASRR